VVHTAWVAPPAPPTAHPWALLPLCLASLVTPTVRPACPARPAPHHLDNQIRVWALWATRPSTRAATRAE
jgi:hypothetical protein